MKKDLWNGVKRVAATVMAVILLTTVVCVKEEPGAVPLVDFEEEDPVNI